jgi:hypothetical protein
MDLFNVTSAQSTLHKGAQHTHIFIVLTLQILLADFGSANAH